MITIPPSSIPPQDEKRYCECGCGSEVKPKRRFISGHNNPMGDPDVKRRHGETLSANAARKRSEYFQQWHLENRERRLLKAKENKLKLKQETLSHYGNGKCICVMCGYSTLAALTLDHIYDDGYAERRSGHELYGYLRKRGFPGGYQTLCMNCQYIKREENGNSTRRINGADRGWR